MFRVEDSVGMNNIRRSLVFLRPYIKHLRVPFQLTLSPLFLWGYFLASLNITPALLIGLASCHLFLYTGITGVSILRMTEMKGRLGEC